MRSIYPVEVANSQTIFRAASSCRSNLLSSSQLQSETQPLITPSSTGCKFTWSAPPPNAAAYKLAAQTRAAQFAGKTSQNTLPSKQKQIKANKMKVLLILAAVVAMGHAHLCLISPEQRGNISDLNMPGQPKEQFYLYTVQKMMHALFSNPWLF